MEKASKSVTISHMISPEDVQKLANLSRIELSSEEKVSFAKDIDSILDYVKQISAVSNTPKQSLPLVRNVLRADTEPHESGLYTEKILAEAPAQEDSYIKVKKILNN